MRTTYSVIIFNFQWVFYCGKRYQILILEKYQYFFRSSRQRKHFISLLLTKERSLWLLTVQCCVECVSVRPGLGPFSRSWTVQLVTSHPPLLSVSLQNSATILSFHTRIFTPPIVSTAQRNSESLKSDSKRFSYGYSHRLLTVNYRQWDM